MLSTAFCVALLAATAVAFALTEGAKTELSPIYGTKIPYKVFSPACNPRKCRTTVAPIEFKLRKRQHLEVWMIRNGKRVATIVRGKTLPKGLVALSFTGVEEDGVTLLPPGTYQPVIRLTGDHRTITLPNTIEIDTTPPEVVRFPKRVYTHISPDGYRRNDVFREPYALNAPAHAILLVNNKQAVFTRSQKVRGVLTWNGTLDGKKLASRPLPAADRGAGCAGNRSKPFPFAVVTIRYLGLGRNAISVAPRHRFALFVLTDAKNISWLFDRGRASSVRTRFACAPRASRPLQPVRHGGGSYGKGDRDRRMSVEAARLGGVFGALGLSVSSSSRTAGGGRPVSPGGRSGARCSQARWPRPGTTVSTPRVRWSARWPRWRSAGCSFASRGRSRSACWRAPRRAFP